MVMKKVFPVLLICMVQAYFVCGQIGAKTQQNVYGIWHNNDFGYQMTLMLQADGSGEFDGEVIKQRIQGNQLFITQGGTTTSYQFVLSGNSLTVSGGDLDAPITFTRSGSSGSAGGKTTNSTSNVNTSTSIIGVWTNYGESIEFKSNGQCIYLGQTFNYQATTNQITLQTAQGNAVMNYIIQQNQLVLTVNGQKFAYTKSEGGSVASVGNTTNTNGNRQLDMSIVGKWCYVNVTSTNSGGTSSDACITIHENGTYEYYAERSMSANTDTFSSGTASQSSDSGTWWVQGNRIFYQSQTQGQGSYQLVKQNHPKTGDPMIVLDGTTYVTYFQKSPW